MNRATACSVRGGQPPSSAKGGLSKRNPPFTGDKGGVRLPPSLLSYRGRGRLILPDGQISRVRQFGCPAPFAKIFPFRPDPNQMHIHCRLVPTRGAIARRHERGAGCGGRESVRRAWQSQGEMNLVSGQLACKMIDALADGKAVWFRHPLLVPSWRRRNQARPGLMSLNPLVTVTTRIRSPGRARDKPLKPLRGECRVTPV